MKLLHLDSSIMGDNSYSRKLTREIVDRLTAQHPDLEVTYRDLNTNPVPMMSSTSFTDEADKTLGNAVLDQFLQSDIIVIGAPMYNFGVPVQVKAWIDRVAVNGKTFRYTENGPVGLAGGKRVIVASSRGGIYSSAAAAPMDHQENYLKTVFAFMGVTDVTFVRAEGVNMRPDGAAKGLTAARTTIAALA